jgi:hypothetical protein
MFPVHSIKLRANNTIAIPFYWYFSAAKTFIHDHVFFSRYGLVAIALLGWIIYQKEIKKKEWSEIKHDAWAVFFFVGVSAVIFYWLFA